MRSSGVNPIHNLKVDGNKLVDIILYMGALNVRLIDYRSHFNQEILFARKEDVDAFSTNKGTAKCLFDGLKYCRVMARLLNTEDLSTDAQQIKKLLENESLNINNLNKTTGIPEKKIVSALDELLAKKLIARVGYEKYAMKDQFGHIRALFDPSKNQHFLT